MRAEPELTEVLRERLAASGMSLRALARAAGVSHSSVSRLLRGRVRPTPGLLLALAGPLHCPPTVLLHAAGLVRPPGGDGDGPAASPPLSVPSAEPWDSLRAFGLEPVPAELPAAVRERLARLREYAATPEAVELAREGLQRKISALGARGPVIDRLQALGRLYLDGEDGAAPPAARLAAGGAVLYFLLGVDAIDDYLFPIGYLDDALAIALAEAEVHRLGG